MAPISQTKHNYDVFLSFRGEDTRHTFTGYLYDALSRKGISTFMDNENLRVGEQIRPQLLQAIEESTISIIVFSENYAASSWCLDELVKILQCKDEKNQLVFPIFYRVDPSDVRHLRNSYGEVMTAHENRYGNDSERVQEWRSALFHISNLTGYHLKEGYEFKFIQNIVSKATAKVSPKQLHIEEDAVGFEFRVEELKSLLDMESNNSTCMLGIHGAGGIGKTTLAKALYNSICYRFESACFLFNIRETSNQDKGQLRLQKVLLSEMLEEGKIKFGSVDKGISIIKERLSKKRVLIVLDDVDKIEQLKELAGGCHWFGSGSRIIITTRDKFLLRAHDPQVKKTYEMNVLNDHDSLKLFCQNAFKMNLPATNYEGLSNRAIRYAKGLPLALKVIGSNLIGKDLDEWKSALDKYEKNPHKDIQSILRISYDSLECNEKDIFLDIACFFKGQRLDYVTRILHGCEFFPEYGIRILVHKSLITVEYGCLRMHDLIQDMGREIVKQQAPKDASERSRLWSHEDIFDVLTETTGSSKIEGIKLDYREENNCIHATFEKMRKLRILIVRNTSFSSGPICLPNQLRLLDWTGYPSQSFPPSFYPTKIAAFNLPFSALVLDKPFQKFEHLTYMNFSDCQSITQFPDVSGATNLIELRLDRCKKLAKVDESVGFLPNLVYLSASGCTHLRSFLPKICLPSLKYLSFNLCKELAHFPDIMGKMDKPLEINMRETAIKELPHSFCNLTGLNHVDMTSCMGLQDLPSNLFMLPNFVALKIGGCPQLRKSLRRFQGSHSIADCCLSLETLHFSSASLSDEDLHVIIQSFPKLKDLNVSSNHFVSFPACIQDSICLTSLDVSYCVKLEEIPELLPSVRKIDARHCNSLSAETSSMLWSQVCKEINRLEIVMPQTKIPEWFDYREEGGIPNFWVRGKLPIVAIAFVFEKVKYEGVGLQLLIDGEHVHGQHQQHLPDLSVAEDHLLLCDLRVLLSDEDWNGVDARVRHHDGCWKSVTVKCETEMILRFWGVYVYNKQETNMGDIQFMCPNSLIPRPASLMDMIEEDKGPSETASRNDLEDSTARREEVSCLESQVSYSLTCSPNFVSKLPLPPPLPQPPPTAPPRLESRDSGSHTHTCDPCCISILSTLKKICWNTMSRKKIKNEIGSEFLDELLEDGDNTSPDVEKQMLLPSFTAPASRSESIRCASYSLTRTCSLCCISTISNLIELICYPMRMTPEWVNWGATVRDDWFAEDEVFGEFSNNASPDVEKQMPVPSFSESLQTVVGNLKRVMAVPSDEEESESEREE